MACRCPECRNRFAATPTTSETFTIDTRNIATDAAKDLLKVWRAHKGQMTVAQARKALVPSNFTLAIKTLWYVSICAGVLFVVFVPLAILGALIGLVVSGFVISQAQYFDGLLKADCAHWKLEVIQ